MSRPSAAPRARSARAGEDRRTDPGPRVETEYRPAHALDLRRVVGFHRRGTNDPAFHLADGVIWRAVRTPAGVAAVALREVSRGVIRAAAWGPGREAAIARVPAVCGADDDPSVFDPGGHPLVSEWHRHHPGLRLSRSDDVFSDLACSVLEQKVTGLQAFGAWRRLVTFFGQRVPAPSPRPLFAPPGIDEWRRIPSWAWHRAGVEPPQSRTIVMAARRGQAMVDAVAAAADANARERVLTSLPGIGAWTAAEVAARSWGCPDAVSVGDYHLAHEVGFALTGHRTDDEGMLALLERWRGQRQRVIRLLRTAGPREPRWGPRLHPEDHRSR